jgi:hypothetical protein
MVLKMFAILGPARCHECARKIFEGEPCYAAQTVIVCERCMAKAVKYALAEVVQ